MILHYIAIEVLAGIILLLLVYVAKELRHQKKHREAMNVVLTELALTELIARRKKYVARKYNTVHGLKSFVKLSESYKALGGNGLIDKLHKDVSRLPTDGDDSIESIDFW